jgi:hypothetical protein
VIWGGITPGGRSIVLAAEVFSSGTRYVEESHQETGGGVGSNFGGALPAGALDRQVFAWRAGTALAVFATRGVRAEARRADGMTVPVPLQDGGGVLADGRGVTSVRVYDAGGALIEERAPGTGLLDVPRD